MAHKPTEKEIMLTSLRRLIDLGPDEWFDESDDAQPQKDQKTH